MVTAKTIVKVQNQTERNQNSDEGLNDAEVTRSVCVCARVCVNVNSVSSQT